MADFTISRGNLLPTLEATLQPPTPRSLVGATVRWKMWSKSGGGPAAPLIDAPAVIVDAEALRVRYDWQAGDTDVVEGYLGRFEVTYADGRKENFPNSKEWVLRITR